MDAAGACMSLVPPMKYVTAFQLSLRFIASAIRWVGSLSMLVPYVPEALRLMVMAAEVSPLSPMPFVAKSFFSRVSVP